MRQIVQMHDAQRKATQAIDSTIPRKCQPLPSTIAERIKDYRAQNVADWAMYRKALASAAEARGWPVHWYDATKVLDAASKALHVETLTLISSAYRRPSGRLGAGITSSQWRWPSSRRRGLWSSDRGQQGRLKVLRLGAHSHRTDHCESPEFLPRIDFRSVAWRLPVRLVRLWIAVGQLPVYRRRMKESKPPSRRSFREQRRYLSLRLGLPACKLCTRPHA